MAETIAAISTPWGEAGIGIIRLSGPEAEAIARRLFRPYRRRLRWRSHQLYLGQIIDPLEDEVVDEVLLTLMRAPHTYTRQDVVEINCHSGYGVLKRILNLALAAGARLARPGEFTLRAYLSGRIDLTQAEAVQELIRSRSAAGLKVAAAHLAGGFGRRVRQDRQSLLELLARVEAALDFPEEAEELPPEELAGALASMVAGLEQVAGTYQEGRLLREGLLAVIAGRPNVGKSSLLNALLAADRAIVTDVPGTTRDVIEESITLEGVQVRLSDTAGLGPARDPVEEAGIERTRERLKRADLVIYLVDASRPLAPEDLGALRELNGRPLLAVLNKIDLSPQISGADLGGAGTFPIVEISARYGQGLDRLKQAIVEQALGGGLHSSPETITQLRHLEHLQQCLGCLKRALGLLGEDTPWELAALELKEAVRQLGEITGEEIGDAVLDRIFAQFCVGK